MTGGGPSGRITMLMISNFGPADGGRETWAYSFIPRLLERWPGVGLDIVGLNRAGEPDNSERLTRIAPDRIRASFIRSARKRYPTLTVLAKATGLRGRADLVIGVGSVVELIVILLSPGLRKARRILWLRTIWVDEKSARLPKRLHALLRRLEVAILRRADLLIANGEDTAAYYRARGLPVTAIANGVDVDRWRCAPPTIAKPLKVAFIGRLAAEKGMREFVALVGEVSGTEFEFHIIGDGPFADDARALEQAELAHVHGPVRNEHLPVMLRGFDACVALTRKSADGGGGGVSNALLEQMAAGRIILAWDNEIFRQLLDDTNAYLVPQGDVAAMEQALRSIVANPDEARAKALKAQETAKGYSFEAHIEKFVAAAEPLLNRKDPP